jgi:hypothetical protein
MQRRAGTGRSRRASIQCQIEAQSVRYMACSHGNHTLLLACHYHLWEMRINCWKSAAPEASSCRGTIWVWVEGKDPADKWAYILLISGVCTPLCFNSHSRARCLLELYINSISQFHSLPNYDSTSQYYVLFHSILPNHHPMLLSPSW